MTTQRDTENPNERKRQSRRRLLASLGIGIAGAYVAPTLFSLGQAQAQHSRRSRPSFSRPGYSRPSYSRPSYSRPSGGYRRDRRDGVYRDYRRDDERSGIRLIVSVPPRW
ncbi:hypothetical protein [Halomonas sp. A11-A]|uniref:hypothetical protein n=1 Tax=Halomonas sp. A11-A TaxID=2183985 RepID=UPI000D713CC5|nr:hypothetical protein [Halomonas sp. A11-A]PWV82847.1 hypothetical protein DER72_10125 [Halomonas sp. A11-A]